MKQRRSSIRRSCCKVSTLVTIMRFFMFKCYNTNITMFMTLQTSPAEWEVIQYRRHDTHIPGLRSSLESLLLFCSLVSLHGWGRRSRPWTASTRRFRTPEEFPVSWQQSILERLTDIAFQLLVQHAMYDQQPIYATRRNVCSLNYKACFVTLLIWSWIVNMMWATYIRIAHTTFTICNQI